VQGWPWALFGAPLVGAKDGRLRAAQSLTLLGPTALFAAFTGVLLFASSLIAGWAENWFVFHRLDSAIAWNPRIVARLGAARARRWAAWWRANVSGMAANVSLGMMLGLVPALLGFVGLPLEVRHVTLSTGQLAAALGALGWGVLASRRLLVVRGRHRRDRRAQPGRELLAGLQGGAALARLRVRRPAASRPAGVHPAAGLKRPCQTPAPAGPWARPWPPGGGPAASPRRCNQTACCPPSATPPRPTRQARPPPSAWVMRAGPSTTATGQQRRQRKGAGPDHHAQHVHPAHACAPPGCHRPRPGAAQHHQQAGQGDVAARVRSDDHDAGRGQQQRHPLVAAQAFAVGPHGQRRW
jgi:hypothetical protein